MKIYIFFLVFFTTIISADSLNALLQEYENTSKKSLKTIDEKMGHVLNYSQSDLQLMQYNTLSDILKEIPLINLNTNRYGLSSPSLAGSKTTTSGFVRVFINDHEISSAHTQSAALTWANLSLDFIDHVEIYYGESSFSLGNETGIYFVRLYTKSPKKENANELRLKMSNKGDNSQSITHSQVLENGWAYLLFLNNEKSNKTMDHDGYELQNNADIKNLYLDFRNDTTSINIGYAGIKKDNYMGLAFDAHPDNGEITSKDFFIHVNKYFLDDKSLQMSFSVDINERENEEQDTAGLALLPVLDLTNMAMTIPQEYSEDIKLTKINALISKTLSYKDNTFLAAFNIKNKQYKVKNRTTVNFFNVQSDVGAYNDFDKETVYSFLFQDDYKLNDNIVLVANAKIDKYKRSGYLEDSTEKLFRIGGIYTPFENIGFKGFYTKTYLPPSFYNTEFADHNNVNIKSQQYNIYTLEGVYTTDNSKFGITYHNVRIEDFLYLTPVGFINVEDDIKTQGLIFDYEYDFSRDDKLHLNYYAIKLNQNINNSDRGGYIKYMSKYDKFSYFTSLLYKGAYDYIDIHVRSSFDLSLGMTYDFSKDLSLSIKGVNLLDKSTKSLYSQGFPGTSFALEDYDRSVHLSLKWVF